MKKKIEKIMDSKIFLTFLIILLISLSIGAGTYAWFTWTSTDNPTVTLTIGRMADVIFDSGPDINITNLSPVFYYDEGVSTTFTIRNGDASHSYQLYNVKINIEEIDPTLSSESFKYALTSGEMFLAEGSFNGLGDGDYVDVITTSMPEGNTTYTMYFYLDSNIENDSSIMTKEFKGSIEVTAPELTGNIATIANLFTPGSTVVNNNISYNVDTTHKLIKDTMGNIRYYGADPSNYIYFNCDTYPDTNCETWRIIGIVDGKVKLMRGENIGLYSWDTSVSTANSGNGINQWGESFYIDDTPYTGADLMKLLNPGYSSNQDLNNAGNTITVNNSLYYNSESGTCYGGVKNVTKACDFTSSGVQGIKNNNTRNKISGAKYYTSGAWNNMYVYPNKMLKCERETDLPSNVNDKVVRTTIWNGRVAVAYPSDYGYAVDLSLCTGKVFTNYNDSTCTSNNWMYSIMTNNGNNGGWLITPISFNTFPRSWYVNKNGSIDYGRNSGDLSYSNPVLYLSPTENITGEGTTGNPYKFSS